MILFRNFYFFPFDFLSLFFHLFHVSFQSFPSIEVRALDSVNENRRSIGHLAYNVRKLSVDVAVAHACETKLLFSIWLLNSIAFCHVLVIRSLRANE